MEKLIPIIETIEKLVSDFYTFNKNNRPTKRKKIKGKKFGRKIAAIKKADDKTIGLIELEFFIREEIVREKKKKSPNIELVKKLSDLLKKIKDPEKWYRKK